MENSNGVDYAALFPAVNQCLLECGCTTVERAAMWFGQVGEESGGLRWMEEIASGAEYEGRTDLGNTQRGDGVRFKGRGPIQVTGRHNYTALSQWAFDQGLVPSRTFFIDQPGQLASDQYGFIGVTWYWTTQRPMNDAADARDIVRATKYVNGGTNGLSDRTQRWQHALGMGDAILPNPDGAPIIQRPNFREINVIGTRQISKQRQNRNGTTVDLLLGHTVEGDLDGEDLIAFMERMGERSYHYIIALDGSTVWDLVDTDYAAWAVLSANNRSINYVIGRSYAAWTRQQWIDNARNAVRVMAYLMVQDSHKYNVEPRVLAPPYNSDPPGISDHHYVTQWLGDGSHTDLGPNFIWDILESDINYFLHGEDDPLMGANIDALNNFLDKAGAQPSLAIYRDSDDPGADLVDRVRALDAMTYEETVETNALRGDPSSIEKVRRVAEGQAPVELPEWAIARAKAILAQVPKSGVK